MILTPEAVTQATGGILYLGAHVPRHLRLTTDTRSLQEGDTFLALRGEKFDGHAYLKEAVEKGAAALIVDAGDSAIDGCTTIVVENTLRAYMAIATLSREQFTGRVIAITGSAGKTTTKFLLMQLLVLKYGTRAIVSPANENNEIGVSKLLLTADSEAHDVVVVEMGARHFGDIKALVDIAKPDLGILTNVGDAHVEIMGSRERLEETKWQLFGSGARAILNASDRTSLERYPSLDRPPHWFFAGPEGGDIPMSGRVTVIEGNVRLHDISAANALTLPIDVRLPGAHNRWNLAAAIAAAVELDVELGLIVAAVPEMRLPVGRYERFMLRSGVQVIYDAYNANAASMAAALDAFAQEKAGRRIAVLSSMAELGEEAEELHKRVGACAAQAKVDMLLVGGDYAGQLAMGALRAGLSSERIVPFVTNNQAAAWIREHARSGDAILLKGSRKYHLEEIVTELVG